MTSRDDASPQISIPALHKALAGRSLPGSVQILDPGLPQTEGTPGCYRPVTLPFSREKAARILAELLAIGEALDVAGPSGSQVARRTPYTAPHKASVSPHEEADLIRFAAAGEKTGAADLDIHPATVAAQKVLLLVWDLEERLLEIQQLRRDVIDAAKPLDESIHGPDREESLVLEMPELAPSSTLAALQALPETEEPDWRLTVAAMAVFLPRDAVLVTALPALRDALQEAGQLAPLPGVLAARLADWPPETRAGSLWAKAPLWRVLGYARKPENAPWLLAEPDIVVCPA